MNTNETMTEQAKHNALAAVFQVAELVDGIARHGRFDDANTRKLLEAVFEESGAGADGLYGAPGAVDIGYKQLEQLLLNKSSVPSHIIQYSLGLMIVQRKLTKAPELMSALDDQLALARRQYEHMGIEHSSVVSSLSDAYSASASQLKYRIQVAGDPAWLSQPQMAERVRALLFAGVRAVTRWRQLGGSRLDLVIRRGKLKRQLAQRNSRV